LRVLGRSVRTSRDRCHRVGAGLRAVTRRGNRDKLLFDRCLGGELRVLGRGVSTGRDRRGGNDFGRRVSASSGLGDLLGVGLGGQGLGLGGVASGGNRLGNDDRLPDGIRSRLSRVTGSCNRLGLRDTRRRLHLTFRALLRGGGSLHLTFRTLRAGRSLHLTLGALLRRGRTIAIASPETKGRSLYRDGLGEGESNEEGGKKLGNHG